MARSSAPPPGTCGGVAGSSPPAQLGVVSAGDMTTEACVTKVAYLCGRGLQGDALRQAMVTDLRGERRQIAKLADHGFGIRPRRTREHADRRVRRASRGKQAFSCLEKDQSFHLFAIP